MENISDLLEKIEILYDLLESCGMSREEISLRIRVRKYPEDKKAASDLDALLGDL